MKKIALVLMFCLSTTITFSQDIFGKWITIDDETGVEKSIVNIYEKNGKVYGKIVDILNKDRKGVLCDKCEGNEKNKPILGLVIIKDLEKEGEYYKNGTIFNPENGKKYTCRITLSDNPDVLQVRGYISFLYATQYWKRLK